MRLSALIFVCALGACASLSGAADQAPPFASAPAAEAAPSADFPRDVDLPAGDYRLDPRHASIVFRIRHMDLAWFTARFDERAATLTLDPADPARSQLRASVNATSVNTGVLSPQGERTFDRSIARALGGEAAPTISFVSTAIERTGQHTARIAGDLSMNGQTRPFVLEATFDGAAVDPLRGGAMVLGFSAHGVLQRSQWGVDAWRAFTGDEVQIVIEAEFVKA